MNSILIVEDDENIRELSDYILSQAGFQVFKASNGRVAMDMLRQQKFNLILLDVHMPIMSGLDVLRSLARPGIAMQPVLMVTANRNLDTINEAMLLGCAGYIVKPFTPDVLVDRVRKALAAKPKKSEEPRMRTALI